MDLFDEINKLIQSGSALVQEHSDTDIELPVTSLPVAQQLFPSTARHVEPVKGSILYTDLFFGYAEHSGIYIGNNRIVELNRRGEIHVVSPRGFMGSGTGICIFVSCRGEKPVGSSVVAERAKKMVGRKRSYNILSNNCHQFTSGCLNGDFENSNNFLWMLKSSAEKYLHTDNWNMWATR